MVLGESKELTFIFMNTGTRDLQIEVVTACKCTDLLWTREAIPPGGVGAIQAMFHSETMEIGPLTKVIDIIANTNPIVVEAKFKANILPKKD